MRPTIGRELGLPDARVVAPATHDTASAVIGVPLAANHAYISSGTWSLVGVERQQTLINSRVESHNFTNEGGAFGTVRFLKNVTGLWILESCRREWQERDCDINYKSMLQHLPLMDECPGLIFPDDPSFLNPSSMLKAIAVQLKANRFNTPEDPFIFTKVILDSLAFRYASVLRSIETLTGQRIEGLHIVGGGSQNEYLNQVTSTVTGLPVLAGPIEATAIGNVVVQAIRDGRWKSLEEARRHVADNVRLKKFYPKPSAVWQTAAARYAEVEFRYQD
jgi:rhamnulokinase